MWSILHNATSKARKANKASFRHLIFISRTFSASFHIKCAINSRIILWKTSMMACHIRLLIYTEIRWIRKIKRNLQSFLSDVPSMHLNLPSVVFLDSSCYAGPMRNIFKANSWKINSYIERVLPVRWLIGNGDVGIGMLACCCGLKCGNVNNET